MVQPASNNQSDRRLIILTSNCGKTSKTEVGVSGSLRKKNKVSYHDKEMLSLDSSLTNKRLFSAVFKMAVNSATKDVYPMR